VKLSAATSGVYAGIVIFQSRDNAQTISLGASASPQLTGAIYAPAAVVSVSGNAQLIDTALVVNELKLTGSGAAKPATPATKSSVSAPGGPLALAGGVPASGTINFGKVGSPNTSPQTTDFLVTPAPDPAWTVPVGAADGGPDQGGFSDNTKSTLLDDVATSLLARSGKSHGAGRNRLRREPFRVDSRLPQ
jgi:hypothetical protein